MIGVMQNCCGLGNSRAVLALCELLRNKKPDFIFLIETFVNFNKIELINNKLDYEACFPVDSNGHSGGLAFIWKHKRMFSLLNFSNHHIDMKYCGDNGLEWRCTGFYGFSDRSRRTEFWSFL